MSATVPTVPERNRPTPSNDDDENASAPRRRASVGDVVTVDMELTPSFGNSVEPLFDRTGSSVSFVLGRGNYVPGLHDLVEGMAVGESVENERIDAGWGASDPDLVYEVPTSRLPPDFDLTAGDRLRLKTLNRDCVVASVTDDVVVFDANPPLAGEYYSCSLTLTAVEDCPRAFLRESPDNNNDDDDDENASSSRYAVATFALGCFWSAELAYMRIPGVVGTRVGYTQGRTAFPTYEDVCSETTGHTEAVMVVYDPDVVSFKRLLKIALGRLGDDVYRQDRVGNDEGDQYRSGVYHHDGRQRREAAEALGRLGEGVATECEPAKDFYHAEEYHQQYLLKGGQSAKKNSKEYIRCYG